MKDDFLVTGRFDAYSHQGFSAMLSTEHIRSAYRYSAAVFCGHEYNRAFGPDLQLSIFDSQEVRAELSRNLSTAEGSEASLCEKTKSKRLRTAYLKSLSVTSYPNAM